MACGKRDRTATERRLVDAVGAVLARDGLRGVGVNALAREAGVDKVLIYRYFGGLHELVSAYARSDAFWPGVDELAGDAADPYEDPPAPARLLSGYFRNYAAAILRRPRTLEILAWEMVERNELTDILDDRRERTALELLQRLPEGSARGTDLTALVAFVSTALGGLAIASARRGSLGGVDLRSDAGWERMLALVDEMLIKLCPPPGGAQP